MAESFGNVDNNLRNWAKEKIQKKSCRCIEQYEKQEEERKRRFVFRK